MTIGSRIVSILSLVILIAASHTTAMTPDTPASGSATDELAAKQLMEALQKLTAELQFYHELTAEECKADAFKTPQEGGVLAQTFFDCLVCIFADEREGLASLRDKSYIHIIESLPLATASPLLSSVAFSLKAVNCHTTYLDLLSKQVEPNPSKETLLELSSLVIKRELHAFCALLFLVDLSSKNGSDSPTQNSCGAPCELLYMKLAQGKLPHYKALQPTATDPWKTLLEKEIARLETFTDMLDEEIDETEGNLRTTSETTDLNSLIPRGSGQFTTAALLYLKLANLSDGLDITEENLRALARLEPSLATTLSELHCDDERFLTLISNKIARMTYSEKYTLIESEIEEVIKKNLNEKPEVWAHLAEAPEVVEEGVLETQGEYKEKRAALGITTGTNREVIRLSLVAFHTFLHDKGVYFSPENERKWVSLIEKYSRRGDHK